MRKQRSNPQPDSITVDQPVADDRPVDVVLHPEPLLDRPSSQAPAKARQHAVDLRKLELLETIWIERAVPVFLCRNGLRFRTGQHQPLFDFGEQQHAPDRWIDRGHQQSVVATRVDAGDRPGGEATEAIRDQPFTGQRQVEVESGLKINPNRHEPLIVGGAQRRASSASRGTGGSRKIPVATRSTA